MSFIGALGNNTDDNNFNFNFNDINIRIVDIDTSNYARFLDSNSSNYTSNVNFNSSNYTSNVNFNTSNYTSNVNFNTSNYTGRIEEELSDRIGYPASLFPLRLTSGVYIPLKAQEVEIATTGEIVGAHTIAITALEEQIVSMVGVGGIIGIITGGTLGGAITVANNAKTKAEEAISTANTAKTTAETATITAEETQTIAEDAQNKANTALSIWNKGTVFAGDANNEAYDYTNNIYHLQTGNVGIGVTNDTELTHKLVVNGNSKLNGHLNLNGSLEIENLNANTFLRFYNYSDATTIKQSGFIYLSDYTEVFAMDTASLPVELRIGTYPIIQVYSNKVDITKNLNVSGDITFTGNLYDANGIFTSGGGGTGGTTYDDTNRLNYEYLRVPTGEGESFVNIQEPTIIQDANIQEPTIDLVIQEPTAKTKVEELTGVNGWRLVRFLPPTATVWFSGNDNVEGTRQLNHTTRLMTQEWTVLFGTFNEYCFSTLNFAHWLYCTKGAVNGANYSSTGRPVIKSSTSNTPYNPVWFNRNPNADEDPWVSTGDHPAGMLYGENSTTPHTSLIAGNEGMCVWVRSSGTTLTTTQPITITGTDYKYMTFLNTGANQTKYNITFNENTEVQLLLSDSTKYIQAVPFNICNSSLELIVGKSSNFSSFSGVSTGTNGITYGSGFVSNITGGNITYNTPQVIIRYKYTKTGTIQPITINDNYKYFSFPQTSSNQTPYNITFQENTEVQLLVASNSFVRYINPFTQLLGKINIIVGNAGGHSSFGSTSTSGQTTPYNAFNSDITGTNTSYNQAIVIVRYKYTRPIIQPITIDNHYKYISFPNYGLNQTSYSLNFQEPTEIQLLLLDGLKYIENAPFTTNGSRTINVGNPSTYDTSTTNTNSTFYNFSTGHLSTITGTSTGYNTPIVIVRYKYKKTVITQVEKYGFLKYNNNNVWDVEPVNTVANILPLLNSNHFEEITNKIALKNFNNSGRFNYQKLSNPGSAGSLVYDNVTGWYMQPEMIYYSLNIIRENNNPNPGFGVVVVETLKTVGLEIKNAEWGKLYITTNPQGKPQYTTDISNGAGSGYMVHHLEVDGSTKINGSLTSTSVSAGTLSTDNLNIGGNRHIFFAGAGVAKITCGDNNHGIFIYQNTATLTHSNPGDELHIKSYSRVSVRVQGSGGMYMAVGGTSWTSLSDRRVKDNKQTIEDGYDTINKMRPVEYRFKNSLFKKSFGFIAQEILEINPELESISYTDDENFIPFLDADKKALSYDNEFIIPNLVSAIKTLIQKVEVLEEKVRVLESNI